MPRLRFDGVSKYFGDTKVIHEFSGEIEDKEFLVLLGPSGCGKSTMLRMIAGLIDITEGSIYFDDKKVNDVQPKDRNVAFVFQSYALYPHLSVKANIAFPLLMDEFKVWWHIPFVGSIKRRLFMRNPEIIAKVKSIAETMELTELLDRRPKTLSGGQRQRVALARALVRNPSIYLLDEPLSNLDAKLRAQMRVEISNLFTRVQKTFIYVTHDQVEAMTMGTRIILLDKGVIQQQGTPQEIYSNPANVFVARFIGSPPMNLFDVELSNETIRFENGETLKVAGVTAPGDATDPYILGVRPEKVQIVGSGDQGLPVLVKMVERLGSESLVAFQLKASGKQNSLAVESANLYFVKVPGESPIQAGEEIYVKFEASSIRWFDKKSGNRYP